MDPVKKLIRAGASKDEILRALDEQHRRHLAQVLRISTETLERWRRRADEARRSGNPRRQRLAEDNHRMAQAAVHDVLGRYPELADTELVKQLAPTKAERVRRWITACRST